MGGSPSQSQQTYTAKTIEPMVDNLPDKQYEKLTVVTPEQQEAATYERLKKQGMSDQGIVSPQELKNEIVGTYRDLKGAIKKKVVDPLMGTSSSPNSYGRDAQKPLSSMEAIDKGLQ